MKTQKESSTSTTSYDRALNQARAIQSHTIAVVDELMLQEDRDVEECMELVDHFTNLIDEVVLDHSLPKGPSGVNLICAFREILDLAENAYKARIEAQYEEIEDGQIIRTIREIFGLKGEVD